MTIDLVPIQDRIGNKGWPTTKRIVSVRTYTRADEFVEICDLMRRIGVDGNVQRWVSHANVIQLDVQPIFPGHGSTKVWYTNAYQGPNPITPNTNILAVTDPDECGITVIELGCDHHLELTHPHSMVSRYRCTDCQWEYSIDHGD